MSQAFKCDRCKKMIEGRPVADINFHFDTDVFDDVNIGNKSGYELCSDCFQDAVLFMENKPTEKR